MGFLVPVADLVNQFQPSELSRCEAGLAFGHIFSLGITDQPAWISQHETMDEASILHSLYCSPGYLSQSVGAGTDVCGDWCSRKVLE